MILDVFFHGLIVGEGARAKGRLYSNPTQARALWVFGILALVGGIAWVAGWLPRKKQS
jgi:hypothetical protein